MRAHALLQAGFAAATTMAVANDARFLLTGPGGMSMAVMDDQGLLSIQSNLSLTGGPSWLAFKRPDKAVVVDENELGLRVVRVNLDDLKKAPEIVQDIKNGSRGVVHLTFSNDGGHLLGAGYSNASVDVWSWDKASATSPLELIKSIPIPNIGLNSSSERQNKPYPHQIVADPTGRFYAVNDLGSDRIWLVDGHQNFSIVSNATVNPTGCGPRHGAFYPPAANHATHYAVVCELSNEVVFYSLKYKENGILFTQKQRISTLGPDGSGVGFAGELVLSADGKHLYVSNRVTGADTDNIAHFTVTAKTCTRGRDVNLAFSDKVSSGGRRPRMFSLTLDGSRALVANEEGPNGVVVMDRDADTGKLTTLEPMGKGAISINGFPDGHGPQFIQQIR